MVVLAVTVGAVVAVVRSVQLDLPLLSMVSGMVIPLLSGLITKKLAGSHVKAICTFALAAAAGGIQTAIQSGGRIDDLHAWTTNIFVAFVTAIAMHYGFFKPTGISDKVQDIAPSTGLGAPTLNGGNVAIVAEVTPKTYADVKAELLDFSKEELYKRATLELGLKVTTKTPKAELAALIADRLVSVTEFPQ